MTYQPRRATGETTSRFQPATGKYSAPDQPTDHQQFLIDLEQLAVDMTADWQEHYATRLRDIARRYA